MIYNMKMKVRYVIVISILLGACNQKNAEFHQKNDITNQNLLIAQNWMDAVVNSDVNKMDSIMNHSCKIFGLGGRDTMNYAEYIDKIEKRSRHATFSNTSEQWLPIEMDGKVFSGEGILFWGVQKICDNNGPCISSPNHIVIIINKGKIESLYFYYDQMKLAKERGFTVSPPTDN